MSLLAFDFETHLIQPGLLAPPIVCGSFARQVDTQPLGHDYYLLARDEAVEHLATALKEPALIFVGANVAYDFGCLLAARPDLLPLIWRAYEEERVFDVLIAGTLDAIADGRLRDDGNGTALFLRNGRKVNTGRYSLETAVEDYLGRSDAKRNDRFRKSYALLENIPLDQWPEDARQYPIDDAVNTLRVCEAQLKECANLHDLPAQAHAAFCMHLGSMWGIKVDAARASALKADVDWHLRNIIDAAKTTGLVRGDGSKDMKAIRERVFKAYDGLPPKTDGGDISTSRETLSESGDPDLEGFGELSKWEKLKTYADALVALDGAPMNVSANPVLNTGRVSYQGLIQLIPRKGKVRECFVPRPGRVLCSVDYAAIEMSTLAQVCLWALGFSKLAEAINADVDPHSLFAANMIGVPYDDFLKRRKEPEFAGYRQAAKAANFGFPGMMGAPTFVAAKKREGERVCSWTHHDNQCGKLGLLREYKGRELNAPLCARCVEEAEKLRKFYLTQWPEMPAYFNWVTAQGEDVEQFVSKRVRGGCSGPAGANTRFQGLAADGAKAALRKMTKEMYLVRSSALYGSRLVVFAHDETLCEHDLDRAHEAGYRQAEIMVEEMRRYVPDVAVRAAPALMTKWTKEADTKFDSSGRLIPWDS